jgi:hypothetical protein
LPDSVCSTTQAGCLTVVNGQSGKTFEDLGNAQHCLNLGAYPATTLGTILGSVATPTVCTYPTGDTNGTAHFRKAPTMNRIPQFSRTVIVSGSLGLAGLWRDH